MGPMITTQPMLAGTGAAEVVENRCLPNDAGHCHLGTDATLAVVQGVIKSYDPVTGDGVLVNEADLADIDLAEGALEGSVFRMLRQGQRVKFKLDERGRATGLHLGSEIDMGTPDI